MSIFALGPAGFGWQEGVVIAFIALLLFGAKRLPEIGRGMGKGIREFRDATKGLADDVKSGVEGDDAPASKPERKEE